MKQRLVHTNAVASKKCQQQTNKRFAQQYNLQKFDRIKQDGNIIVSVTNTYKVTERTCA